MGDLFSKAISNFAGSWKWMLLEAGGKILLFQSNDKLHSSPEVAILAQIR
jgi:hypothetical protein